MAGLSWIVFQLFFLGFFFPMYFPWRLLISWSAKDGTVHLTLASFNSSDDLFHQRPNARLGLQELHCGLQVAFAILGAPGQAFEGAAEIQAVLGPLSLPTLARRQIPTYGRWA
jgi:hypothetical protein